METPGLGLAAAGSPAWPLRTWCCARRRLQVKNVKAKAPSCLCQHNHVAVCVDVKQQRRGRDLEERGHVPRLSIEQALLEPTKARAPFSPAGPPCS